MLQIFAIIDDTSVMNFGKKLQHNFPKMSGGGGKRPFGTFSKIHPFWKGNASLTGPWCCSYMISTPTIQAENPDELNMVDQVRVLRTIIMIMDVMIMIMIVTLIIHCVEDLAFVLF